jgi:hypothetical protein
MPPAEHFHAWYSYAEVIDPTNARNYKASSAIVQIFIRVFTSISLNPFNLTMCMLTHAAPPGVGR